MELLSATDIQFGTLPVIQVWVGNSLVWSKTIYWTGLGSNNNWSTAANWLNSKSPTSSSSLEFAGTTRLSAFNDLTVDTPFNSLAFNANSGSFQLSGNRFVILSGGFINNSPNAQTVNNDVKLSSGNNRINVSTGSITTFNGVLSGIGSIVKTGSGLANVSMARTISTGSVTISAGTLQFNNLTTNGGTDLAGPTPTIYNLNGNGATLNIFSNAGGANRAFFGSRTVNYSSLGSQTLSVTGNILMNGSTFITNGGPKNFISGSPVPGSNYFNGQFTSITYNVADGTDDVDLEVNVHLYNHLPIKTGAGKMSVVTPFSIGIAGPLNILAGTFDIGTGCSIPTSFTNGVNTIANNGTFSYSSNVNSNCSGFAISGTGNFLKDGTSTLTLSSNRCTYSGSTSITNGSIAATKDTATATFTNTTLTVSFSTPPSIGNTFRFFPGTTIQTYASVSLIGAPGRTASYNSTNSTLTIDS
jgi:autotransporter-associated beta strand protein